MGSHRIQAWRQDGDIDGAPQKGRDKDGTTRIQAETESLVREYQRSAIPDMCDLKLMEFYGGAEWRLNEEADLKRCIQRILEIELVDNYQKNSRLSDEVRCALKEIVGENWREEQGLPGRNYIGMIAKRERIKKRESLPMEEEETRNEKTKGEGGEQESGDPKEEEESLRRKDENE